MPKASDITLAKGDLSFLLIGENGSGKTKFFEGFKNPYIFDFDKGIATLRHCDHVEYDTFKDVPHGQKVLKAGEGMYEYGKGWEAFIAKLNQIGKQMDEGTCPFDALGFDSNTMMQELLMNHILKQDNKGGKNPEIQHWGTFNRVMSNTINQITAWPGIKVMTAHIERAENPLTNGIELLPLAPSKWQGMMPNFFDEVYFCEVNSKPGPNGTKLREYTIHAYKDALRKNARTRWDVPVGTPTSWTAVKKALEAAGSTKSTNSK